MSNPTKLAEQNTTGLPLAGRRLLLPAIASLAVLAAWLVLSPPAQEATASATLGVTTVVRQNSTALDAPGLRVPLGLKVSEVSAAASFAGKLRGLDAGDGAALLDAAIKGIAPSASWDDKILAMEALRLCRGFVHPRVITSQLLDTGTAPAAGTVSALGLRQRRCDSLLALPRSAFDEASQRLADQLSRADSPLALPDLRTAAGQPVPDAALSQAKAKLRQGLAMYGAAALEWFQPALLTLATLEGAGAGRINLWADDPARPLVAASEIARCYSEGLCSSTQSYLPAACSNPTLCRDEAIESMLASQPDASAKERSLQLARELTAAVQLGDWARLGL